MMSKGLIAVLVAVVVAPLVRAEDSRTAVSGTFVAVGYGGRRMSSTDGIHWENVQQWEEKGGDNSNNLISIAYGNGLFVAVGGGGWSRDSQAGHILVSSDGKDWTEVLKLPNRISPVMFGNGRFVAGGPDKTLWWSADGKKWQPGAKVDFKGWAFWFRSGAYGNGTFVFRGNAEKDQKVQWCFTSHDGTSVTPLQVDLPEGATAPCFGAGKFLMIAKGGICLTSADGEKWDRKPIAGGEELQYAVWTGKLFYAAGKKGAFTSADGLVWTKLADRVPARVLYGSDSLFIGTSWPGQMWHSSDGVKWEKDPALPPNGINAIAFAPSPAK